MEDQIIIWANDKRFKGLYAGRPAVVIGRGDQSEYQRDESIDSLPSEIVRIGCNSAYKSTRLDCLVWLDGAFFTEHWKEITSATPADCLKFGVNPIHYFHNGIEMYGLRAERPERCSESFDGGFYPCELSGYIACNVALLFGCNPVWLHGFNPKSEELVRRSGAFQLLADWAKGHDRQVYLTAEDSFLRKFFDYQPLPTLNREAKKGE